jgi:oxygen-independent coproporphyrinogen III oxidase
MSAAVPDTIRADPILFPQGLYVHLPFCAAICTYCDFASEVYAAARAKRYLPALENELRVQVDALGGDFAPRTVFLGGGTPSAFDLEELKAFFDLLERHLNLSRVEEFTIEANPGSTDAAKLEYLLQRGVRRISFGVQSFQPHLLKLLGRVHGASQGREAVTLARKAGYQNVSIDLMHGLPTQTLDQLRDDLRLALDLGTDHISAYGLIYEDGTPLEDGGLPQYEISNYARPGYEAQHNLIYWRGEAYLGVGVSAASYVHGERRTNWYEMDRYMNAAKSEGRATESSEQLDAQARAREALVLAWRLREGVDLAAFGARWNMDVAALQPRVDVFLREGLMERLNDGRIRIARAGLPVADGILAEFV